MSRILIVDDEAGIRRTLSLFLEAAGHQVRTAGTVAEARIECEAAVFDVVLSDIIMPGDDGIRLLEYIRRRAPLVPVILITGEPSLETATEALRLGAFDYLSKPLRKDTVCRVVDQASQVGALRRENERLNEENRKHREELESLVAERTSELMERTEQREALLLRLRGFLDDAIGTVAMTVEVRDPYTAGHQRHVAALTREIAIEMDLEESCIDIAYRAAQVHDIGKIAVPLDFLAKPSALSELEFAVIKVHCKVGYELLSRGNFPWPIAEIVYQHHERLDGSGYPRRLQGDAIALEARIITVADLVEAMSAHRPYRPALGIERALSEIELGRGTHYDPRVVDACLSLFREKGWSFDSLLHKKSA